MRQKSEFRARAQGLPEADLERVRSDLEDRGVDPQCSGTVAQRLIPIIPDLSALEYAAVLDGVSTAYRVRREIPARSDAYFRHGNELQRLMQGLTGELRKLDEGLQMLSAYLVRMGALLSSEGSGNLH